MENGGAMEMSEKYCNTCRWYDLGYATCGNRESDGFGKISRVIDCCDYYEEYNSNKHNNYWKREAQSQAAAAGELRILLAYRLEELRTQQTALRKCLALEDHDLDRVILQCKVEQLQEHIDWLEGVLYE